MHRKSLAAALAALSLTFALTASTALAARPVFVFTTQLTGEAERPALGDLDAHGSATVAVFPDTDTVCWVVTWNHVDGTVFASHIHGPVGTDVAGPVLIPLFMGEAFGANGMHRGCASAAGWSDDIVASPELFYVNVHSLPNFGPGAIRGQLG